jgi:alpha-beta hydrolase superfamily lysophospholipase
MPEGRNSARAEGHFEAGDGARLFYVENGPLFLEHGGKAAAPRAVVVLMHGFGEHCGRYDAFAEYLSQRGHVVSRFDARGHGQSSGRRGHVRDFDDYVRDLSAFSREATRRYVGSPLVLLGHSNGGLVTLRAVQLGLLEPRALVLTGPLLRLRKKPAPDVVAKFLSWAVPGLPLPSGIETKDLTHDPELLAAHAADRWVHHVATPRWYWSMKQASERALADASCLTLPLLVVCGELDPVVDPAGAKELHARAASRDKELVERAGEYHEVLNETNRRELFERIAAWLERVLGAQVTGGTDAGAIG